MPANKRDTTDDQVDELDVKPPLEPSTPPSKKKKGSKASPSHTNTGSTPSSSPGSKGSKVKLAEMIIEAGIAHLSRSEAEAATGFTGAQLTQLLRKDKGAIRRALLGFAETL